MVRQNVHALHAFAKRFYQLEPLFNVRQIVVVSGHDYQTNYQLLPPVSQSAQVAQYAPVAVARASYVHIFIDRLYVVQNVFRDIGDFGQLLERYVPGGV